MKSYSDTTESVIKKAEKLNKSRRRRKHMTITAACCACIVALVCVSLTGLEIGQEKTGSESILTDNITATTENTPTDDTAVSEENKQTSAQESENNTNVNINYLSEIPQSAFYALREDLFTAMSKEEQFEYYGVEFDLSEVLAGFTEADSENYGIGKYGVYSFADGGTEISQCFAWEKSNQSVTVTLAKNDIPPYAPFRLDETGNWADDLENSEIEGVNVLICSYTDSEQNNVYTAEFMQDDIGYYVVAHNLEEEDFIAVLTYLITLS